MRLPTIRRPSPAPAKRGLTYSQMWNTGADSTTSVDESTARRVMAVYACQSLISGDLATLPFGALRKLRPSGSEEMDPQPSWLTRPDPVNPNFTRVSYIRQVVMSLLQDGNAFIAVAPSVFDPARLVVLNPKQVTIREGDDGLEYQVTDTSGKNELGVLSSAQCVHIPFILPPGQNRGLNPIESAELGIRLSLSAEKQGEKFYGDGGLVTGIIEIPAGQGELTPEQKNDLRDSFKRKREGGKGYSIGVLEGGAQFKQMMLSAQDAQYIETRKYELEEIARLYLVPPFMIGSQEASGVAYASAVERAKHYIDHCLIHYAVPVEKGHDRLLRGGDRTFTKFDFGAFLRGDILSRYTAYEKGLQAKFLYLEDVWADEDLNPNRPGTTLETPNNNGPREAAAPEDRSTHVHMSDITLPDTVAIPAPVVNVAAPPAPEVRVEPAVVNVAAAEAPVVNVEMQPVLAAIEGLRADVTRKRTTRKQVLRDEQDRVVGVMETEG